MVSLLGARDPTHGLSRSDSICGGSLPQPLLIPTESYCVFIPTLLPGTAFLILWFGEPSRVLCVRINRGAWPVLLSDYRSVTLLKARRVLYGKDFYLIMRLIRVGCRTIEKKECFWASQGHNFCLFLPF